MNTAMILDPSEQPDYLYRLPSGQVIAVAADLCHGCAYVSYTLAGGRQTLATRVVDAAGNHARSPQAARAQVAAGIRTPHHI